MAHSKRTCLLLNNRSRFDPRYFTPVGLFAELHGCTDQARELAAKFATGTADVPQICRRCQRQGWQLATGFNDKDGKFATGINDTGGK